MILSLFTPLNIALFITLPFIFIQNLAELLAIHRACVLIPCRMHLLDRNITILSDSKLAVSWINGEGFGNLNFFNLYMILDNF